MTAALYFHPEAYSTAGPKLMGRNAVICPLLSGPKSVLDFTTKEEWKGKEGQGGGDHRQAA